MNDEQPMNADSGLKLTLRRRFDAPVDRLYRYWIDNPEDPSRFWGPQGFTLVERTSDAETGGRWRLAMRAPDGTVWVSGGEYRVLRPPTFIEMTHAWLDERGRPRSPRTIVRVTLTAVGDATEMLFEQTGFESAAERDGHSDGWSEAFDRLAGVVR